MDIESNSFYQEISKERNFYFNKVSSIDILLDYIDHNTSVHKLKENLKKILYADLNSNVDISLSGEVEIKQVDNLIILN